MIKAKDDWDSIPQVRRFHAPLQRGDGFDVTNGCRHTQPAICGKNDMPDVCAFVRPDGMCHAPPLSWKKQFVKLEGDQQRDSLRLK